MITAVKAGAYTVRGLSLGGVYTALHVPELDVAFDCGVALRSAAGVGTLCLSHAHADHIGALNTLLGIRGLQGVKAPLRVVMPAEILETLLAALRAMTELQRWPLDIQPVPVEPGDLVPLKGDFWVRAVKTFHPVPSLAYQVVRRVQKLKPELAGMPGAEIAARRKAGTAAELFEASEHAELAYVTDTLVQVFDHAPALLASKVLVMETTFLDDRKSLEASRAGCHIHLDEVLARAGDFVTPNLVLMHVSQLYQPAEVAPILDARMPAELRARTQALVPAEQWPL
ncbi:MAG: MBL fold metallo-hydrolase [Kofleriaceae bacterium]|nr:MAG: MBL fold metallo-hydrolase [Kofleriaceae bacterium]